MIAPDDIRLFERDDPMDFTRRITADLRLRSDVRVTEFALATSRRSNAQEMLREARIRAGREIWHKLYGDLPREIHELRREVARAVSDFNDFREIDERFSKLLTRLRPPV